MSRRRTYTSGRRRASVLITVTFVSMFTMLLGVSLITHHAVEESAQIDESLAKVRIYWAHVGHMDYVLSKARQVGSAGGGLCYGSIKDFATPANDNVVASGDATDDACPANNTERLGALWSSISDLQTTVPAGISALNSAPARRRWDYGNDYVLDFDIVALDLGTADTDINARLGKVRLISNYSTPDTSGITAVPPVISGLAGRVRDYELQVCFVESLNLTTATATICPSGADANPTANPLGVNHNDGHSRVVAAKRCYFSPSGTVTNNDICDETP